MSSVPTTSVASAFAQARKAPLPNPISSTRAPLTLTCANWPLKYLASLREKRKALAECQDFQAA